jgi:hypothetical protein
LCPAQNAKGKGVVGGPARSVLMRWLKRLAIFSFNGHNYRGVRKRDSDDRQELGREILLPRLCSQQIIGINRRREYNNKHGREDDPIRGSWQ